MNWFLANPKKLATAELETCKLALYKAEGSKAWAESMIAYNTRRIGELERYLGTQPEVESGPSFSVLPESFKKFAESVSLPGFESASSAATTAKGKS